MIGTQDNPHHIFSFGGGVQSTAALVLAAQGAIPARTFYFANVGNDSENPGTLEYMAQHALPFAERHGLEFVEVQAQYKGQPDTLLSAIERRQGSIVIPALVKGTGVSNRTCTVDFKIRVINRELKRRYPKQYIRVGIGFSIDEWQRAKSTEWTDKGSPTAQHSDMLGYWRQYWYPLLEMRLSRTQCHALITAAGLPTPPKSSCYFCPYHLRGEWITMKQQQPELFERACQIDDLLASRHQRLQGKPVFLHPERKPLRDAVPDQSMMFTDDPDAADAACDIGHCMT